MRKRPVVLTKLFLISIAPFSLHSVESLLDGRQENAAVLKFKCNRVGTMTESETVELRNEIKVSH